MYSVLSPAVSALSSVEVAVDSSSAARRRRRRALSSEEIPSPIRDVGDEPEVAPLMEIAPGHFVATHRVGGPY